MESAILQEFSDLCACGCGGRISARALKAKEKGTTEGYIKGHTWKNRTMPEESKIKMSLNHADFSGDKNPNYGKGLMGEDNPNWQGGKVHLFYNGKNQPKANIKQDREFKAQIKERDKRCIFCLRENRLTVHHIESVVDSPNRQFDETNGVTLCISCHTRADNRTYKEVCQEKCLEYIRSLYGR
jgi:hypothetical protein